MSHHSTVGGNHGRGNDRLRALISSRGRRVANLGSAGDRTLSCVFVSKSSVSCARANWLEVWLTMRPRFTARPLSEITPIVRPEAQQNPSDSVISESYRGSEHALSNESPRPRKFVRMKVFDRANSLLYVRSPAH